MRRASNISYESGSLWIDPRIAVSLPLDRVWRGRAIGIVVETKGPLLVVFVIASLCFNDNDVDHDDKEKSTDDDGDMNENDADAISTRLAESTKRFVRGASLGRRRLREADPESEELEDQRPECFRSELRPNRRISREIDLGAPSMRLSRWRVWE